MPSPSVSREKSSESHGSAVNRIIIIGAGLGGMAAAITLAARGYRVEMFEKNSHAGGKLNFLLQDGFNFDLGPSILTMPQIFTELFTSAGKKFSDYVPIKPLSTHWRNFFEDGTVIDLVGDFDEQQRLFSRVSPALPGEFVRFLNYAHEQYRVMDKAFFRNGPDTFFEVVKNLHPWELGKIDGLRTLHTSLGAFFSNRHIRDIFSYFAKYIGSSPFKIPAFLNLLPWIQYAFGLWYVPGGMYNLARGMTKLLRECGVALHLNTEVAEILVTEKKATGIRLADGTIIPARIIVSNMEVIPAFEKLLPASPIPVQRFHRFEPSCSGLVLHLGVNKVYPQLAHHNFLYSCNSKANFNAIFEEYRLPDDPTIYLVAPCRTDPSLAPGGCDIIKLLPHLPHLSDKRHYSRHDYECLKNRIFEKCERMGLQDLRKHVITEYSMTPSDIERMYYSNRGSIYGVVTDYWKNYALKFPKRSDRFPNLFFCGGSVNPGGGMPMVVLGGMHAARRIEHAFPLASLKAS